MTYQVGDRVRIIKRNPFDELGEGAAVGDVGTVVEVGSYGLRVRFDRPDFLWWVPLHAVEPEFTN